MTTFAELLASVQEDRIRDWTRTGGTGPFTVLDSPPAGYSGFSRYTTGASVYYCIVDTQGRWGVYRGVWTAADLSLSVAERLDTSTGAEIDWDADTKQIFTVLAAENIRDILDEIEGKASTGHTHSHDTLTGLADDDHTQYHTDARALTWLGTRSTADLPEGANLYFTNERVDDRVAALIQNGSNITWTYNDVANTLTGNVTFSLAGKTTDDLTEGATNLYFTNERAQDAVGTILTDSATVDFTYDDASNTITAIVIDDSISNAKLRNSAAVSVIGRSANSTGDPADIAAGSNDTILRRVSNALDFGQLTIGMIPDALITKAKIENVAASKLLGAGSAGASAPAEITLGTGLSMSGTTLSASGSGWTLLSTANPSSASSANFDGLLTSSYTLFMLVFDLIPSVDGAAIQLRSDSNAGASYDSGASDYRYAMEGRHDGAATASTNSTGATAFVLTEAAGSGVGNDTTAGEGIVGCLIINRGSATRRPIFSGFVSYLNASTSSRHMQGGGSRNSTAAIDSVQILPSSGNITGQVKLFGAA